MSPVTFRSPNAGGDWYTPERMGMYRMKLVDIEDGPDLGYGPTVKWKFQMFEMDGTPIKYTPKGGPNEGVLIEAIADGLTSYSTGPKSTAAKWFKALLGRPLANNEDMTMVQAEALGRECLGSWGPNDKGRNVIQSLMPI